MTPAEILRKSADVVRRGWCQDTYSDGDGFCAKGAVRLVIGRELEEPLQRNSEDWFRAFYYHEQETYRALIDLLGAPYSPSNHCHIARWNDGAGQTAENVASAMELAAILWEHEHAAVVPDPVPVTSSALGGEG